MDLKVTDTFNKTSLVYFTSNARQIISVGGSRSSKSYSILQILMLELIANSNLKITVWRDTKVTCRSTVLEDFKKIIMFDETIYKSFKENKQSGTFTYKPTNSRIIFEGADNIGKVLGGAQDISFFNEVTEFSKSVYLQITQRTAGRVICDYNPSKDFWLEKYREDPDTVFIHSTFKDNSFCPANIVKQLLSYEPWIPGSYEIVGSDIYYKGKPVNQSNQPPANELNVKRGTADTFMWLVYGLGLGSERPNKIYHGWKQISEDKMNALEAESYFGMDFGQANPTAVVRVKHAGGKKIYVQLVGYKPLGNIKDSLGGFVDSIPSISKDTSIIIADPAKQAYINTLKDAGYMAINAVKGPGSILSGIGVVQGLDIYYVKSNKFMNEYNNYSWQLDRYEKATDIPIKVNDHAMDAIRYVLSWLVKYLDIK